MSQSDYVVAAYAIVFVTLLVYQRPGEALVVFAVAALTDTRHVGQLYELTGPRLLTFPEAIRDIASAAGRDAFARGGSWTRPYGAVAINQIQRHEQARILDVLQPEAEPVKVAAINGQAVSGLNLDVRLVGENVKLEWSR